MEAIVGGVMETWMCMDCGGVLQSWGGDGEMKG